MTRSKLALITGVTSGIGLCFARLLKSHGYQLILVGRSQEKLGQVRDELGAETVIDSFCFDLAAPDTAQQVFDACQEKHYQVDLLINNAGVGVYGEFSKEPMTVTTNMLNLNIVRVTEMCHLFGNAMRQRKQGSILNIASTAAFQPVPYLAAYAASKSYVLHFSEALRAELKADNVHVCCLCPGPTATNFMHIAGIGDQSKGVFSQRSMMTVEQVVDYGWQILQRNKAFGIPGVQNRVAAFLNRLVPRAWVISISKAIMGSMLNR